MFCNTNPSSHHKTNGGISVCVCGLQQLDCCDYPSLHYHIIMSLKRSGPWISVFFIVGEFQFALYLIHRIQSHRLLMLSHVFVQLESSVLALPGWRLSLLQACLECLWHCFFSFSPVNITYHLDPVSLSPLFVCLSPFPIFVLSTRVYGSHPCNLHCSLPSFQAPPPSLFTTPSSHSPSLSLFDCCPPPPSPL